MAATCATMAGYCKGGRMYLQPSVKISATLRHQWWQQDRDQQRHGQHGPYTHGVHLVPVHDPRLSSRGRPRAAHRTPPCNCNHVDLARRDVRLTRAGMRTPTNRRNAESCTLQRPSRGSRPPGGAVQCARPNPARRGSNRPGRAISARELRASPGEAHRPAREPPPAARETIPNELPAPRPSAPLPARKPR